jgi:hypothetical protein
MAQLSDILRWETTTGDAIAVGGLTIRPQSRALIVRWRNGGLVWNRPVAVLVDQDGQTRRLPVRDPTRVVQIGLLGLGLVCFLVPLLSRRSQ